MWPSGLRKLDKALSKYQEAELITPPKLEWISTSALLTVISKVTIPLLPPEISNCPKLLRLPCSQTSKSAPRRRLRCLDKYLSKSVEADSSAPSIIKMILTGKSPCSRIYFRTAVKRAVMCPLSSSTPRPYITP